MIAPAQASERPSAAPRATPRDRSRPDTGRRYHEHFLSTPSHLATRREVPVVVYSLEEMATKVARERLRSLVEPYWRRLYNFVFRLTLDRERAERCLVDLFEQAAEEAD